MEENRIRSDLLNVAKYLLCAITEFSLIFFTFEDFKKTWTNVLTKQCVLKYFIFLLYCPYYFEYQIQVCTLLHSTWIMTLTVHMCMHVHWKKNVSQQLQNLHDLPTIARQVLPVYLFLHLSQFHPPFPRLNEVLTTLNNVCSIPGHS